MPQTYLEVDGLFVPDIILPSQQSDSRSRHLEPEKQLMLAVLADAVRCFLMGSVSTQGFRRRLSADAARWLLRAKGNGPFSLNYICEALEIDPSRFRRGILHCRDRGLEGETPRMIRRPHVLPLKRARGRGSRSRREG
jgi:hypothetical protein